jgi:hypothetical protein
MRIPLIYSPIEIKQWLTEEEYLPGKWCPARPCPFNFWSWQWIRYRFSVIWKVWIGKYDLLNWEMDKH